MPPALPIRAGPELTLVHCFLTDCPLCCLGGNCTAQHFTVALQGDPVLGWRRDDHHTGDQHNPQCQAGWVAAMRVGKEVLEGHRESRDSATEDTKDGQRLGGLSYPQSH